MTWYLVQFHSDGKHFRLIDKAYEDGYAYGDRFLEGAMFEVALTEDRSDFTVKADDMTAGYLEDKHSSPEAWSKDISDSLHRQGGGDMLVADEADCTGGWDQNEVHLTNADLKFYTEECNLTLVE